MNFPALTLLFVVAFQQPGGLAGLPPAAPLLGPSICGAGKFLLKLDGKSAGEETFDINCRADGGYSVTGRTELKVPGASSDLATTLELDKEGLPQSSTAKGTVLGQAFEQTVTIKDHSALLTSPDGSREIPYEKGTP